MAGSCEHGDAPSSTINAKDLLVSQEGHCSMELVVSYVAAVTVLL